MRLEDVELAPPAADEVQLRHTAIGVNFIDVYDRTGFYPQPLPAGLGREGAGVITAVGRKVRGLKPGQRVAYVTAQPGSYCEVRNVPAARVVKVPAGVSDEQAAVLMLKGMTACYLLRHTHDVKRGDVIVVFQVAFVVVISLVAIPRLMGKDYDAIVMSSGFCGFMLGTTANAVANMGALVERYGPAPKAYLVVPLVGAFGIDFVNGLLITAFLNIWR